MSGVSESVRRAAQLELDNPVTPALNRVDSATARDAGDYLREALDSGRDPRQALDMVRHVFAFGDPPDPAPADPLPDLVAAVATWPELIYAEPGGRFVAYLTGALFDFDQLDWRQRAAIRAGMAHVTARLDAADAHPRYIPGGP